MTFSIDRRGMGAVDTPRTRGQLLSMVVMDAVSFAGCHGSGDGYDEDERTLDDSEFAEDRSESRDDRGIPVPVSETTRTSATPTATTARWDRLLNRDTHGWPREGSR